MKLYVQHLGENFTDIATGGPSSRLEKKPTIDSWKRHALCDSMLRYERKRWEFNSFASEAFLVIGNVYLALFAMKSL